MLNWGSRRLLEQTMLGLNAAAISGAGFPFCGLFNNGIQGEWLILRDFRAASNTLTQLNAYNVQGTHAGALNSAVNPFILSAAVLAGQIFSGHDVAIPAATAGGRRILLGAANAIAYPWSSDRPFDVILPGFMWFVENITTGATLNCSFEWLVIDPKELA